MSYKFHADEQVWRETVFNEEMECVNGGKTTDIVDNSEVSYFWISSTEREEVLKVIDFPQGEEAVMKLSEGTLGSFEDAEEHFEHAEIQDERPPY